MRRLFPQTVPCPLLRANPRESCSFRLLAEPMGSARPKFPTVDNSRGFVSSLSQPLTLLCPAQGFPVPWHRWEEVALSRQRSTRWPFSLFSSPPRACGRDQAQIPNDRELEDVHGTPRPTFDPALPGPGVPGSSVQVGQTIERMSKGLSSCFLPRLYSSIVGVGN